MIKTSISLFQRFQNCGVPKLWGSKTVDHNPKLGRTPKVGRKTLVNRSEPFWYCSINTVAILKPHTLGEVEFPVLMAKKTKYRKGLDNVWLAWKHALTYLHITFKLTHHIVAPKITYFFALYGYNSYFWIPIKGTMFLTNFPFNSLNIPISKHYM